MGYMLKIDETVDEEGGCTYRGWQAELEVVRNKVELSC